LRRIFKNQRSLAAMKKIILLYLLLGSLSVPVLADGKINPIKNNLCINNNLTYSIGSVIYEENKKYLCSFVYGKNREKGVAWVELKITSGQSEENIIVYK
jgi:predicted membrane channel-forming protein YqfA (hemolysin III family)